MKKLLFIPALALGISFASVAGTPENGKPEAKSEAASAEKAKETFIYYVTGITGGGTQYVLSTDPQAACGTGENHPCKLESESMLSSPIDKATVDNEDGLDIISRRQSL